MGVCWFVASVNTPEQWEMPELPDGSPRDPFPVDSPLRRYLGDPKS
jgi:hypothetical protein